MIRMSKSTIKKKKGGGGGGGGGHPNAKPGSCEVYESWLGPFLFTYHKYSQISISQIQSSCQTTDISE